MNRDEKTGISYRRWISDHAKSAFILIHGLGAHTGRWSALATYLYQNGFSSYALELRGFGRTKGIPGYVDSFNTYLTDILRLRDIVSKENPGKKIFIMGESMGALAAFLVAVKKPSAFDGAVLLSPAFTSRLKFGFLEYLDMTVAFCLYPKKAFKIPFNTAMLTRDPEYQKMLDTDRKERRVATAKLLLSILLVQLHSRLEAKKISIPTLFLLAGDDQLVDPKDSKSIFKELKVSDKKLIEYPDMRHAISIDIGKENVFRDILAWANKRR
jgi:alpha-beta hydrolase superfamily lysophospholipase